MTKAELMALSAGRELDRIVAERVFDWIALHDDGVSLSGVPPTQPKGFELAGTGIKGHWHVPRYSTDIAAAWQVVEQMHLLGNALALERWLDMPSKNKWLALFTLENGHDTGSHVAESAPLAICRAALVAADMAKT